MHSAAIDKVGSLRLTLTGGKCDTFFCILVLVQFMTKIDLHVIQNCKFGLIP